MSSFGYFPHGGTQGQAGGQSTQNILQGLDLSSLGQTFGKQIGIGQNQPTAAVQPGQMAGMNPQQRLAAVLRQYQGA